MNEELKVNEMEETKEFDVNEVEMDCEDLETSGGGLLGLVAVVGGIVGAGVAAYKNRDKIANKITERKIRKLEKKGYTVIEPKVDEQVEIKDAVEKNDN